MHHRLWFWLPLILLRTVSRSVAGALPATAPHTAADSSSIALTGLFAHEAEIPHGFSADALYNQHNISPVHTILACMLAMRELALHDFNDVLTLGFHLWRYGAVMVGISHPDKGDRVVAVRYALWTIFLVLKDMLQRNFWQDSKTSGEFRGRNVAVVDILPVHSQSHAAVSEGLTMTQEPGIDDNDTAAAAVQRPDGSSAFSFNSSSQLRSGIDNEQDAHIDYLDKPVNSRDIVGAICMLLINSFPRNRETLTFAQVRIIGPVTAEVWSAWNTARPPPPEPLRMSRGDFISFLAKLPEHLYIQKKWFEMNVALSENGVPLAKGFFRTKP
ncbi:MAG: hypothetical protein LQ350_002321 [Teloschistes chrysophthalmus]|nr:MAG: hypothetical protein LQ350_002321 [Niorma chrysophthalma]